MSKTVDERVLEMRFENGQFEKNVNTSISTLDRLKKSLNLTGAAKGLEEVDSAANKMKFSKLENSLETVKVKFSALQVIGITALSNLTTAAMNTGKKLASYINDPLVEGGKKRALNIEQAKFQLKGLGVAWDSIKDDINYGVKDTAYGLDAAARVAAQLVASNIKVGDSMKTALRGVSGVAAMTGSSYEEIGHIFTTVAGNGKLMAMQLNQIGERGLNAAAALGQFLGVSESKVREMTSKGKIDFETFAKAMDSAFGEHAKAANETFTGSMSNVRAALSRIGADFATPVFDNLKNIFNALIPVINTMHTALGPVITDFTNFANVAGDKIVSWLTKFKDSFFSSGWDKLKTQIKDLGVPVDDFQNKLVETAKSHGIAIDEIIAKTGSLENSLTTGWASADIISETLNSLGDNVKVVTTQFLDFHKMVDRVINGDFGNGITRVNKLTKAGWDYYSVQKLVNDVWYGRSVDWDKVSNIQVESVGYTEKQTAALKELAAQAAATGTPLNELIKTIDRPSLGSMVVESFRNITQGISKIFTAIKEAAAFSFNFIPNNFIANVIEAFYNLSEKINISDEAASKLSETFVYLFSFLNSVGNVALNVLSSLFKIVTQGAGVITSIFSALSPLAGLVLQAISGLSSLVARVVTTVAQSNILSSALSRLGSAVKLVSGFVFVAVDAFSSWAKQIGILDILKNIIEGIKNTFTIENITSALKALGNGIKGLYDSAKNLPIVQKAIDGLMKLFDKLPQGIKDFINNGAKGITDFVNSLKSMDGLTFSNVRGAIRAFAKDVLHLDSAIGNIRQFSIDFSVGIGGIGSNIANAFSSMTETMKGFIDFVKSKFTNIGIGEILMVAFGVAYIKTLITFANAIQSVSKVISGLASPITNLGKMFKSIGGYFDELAAESKWNRVSNTVKSFAISIGILAASLALLSNMDQGKLWSSVGALSVMSGVMTALTLVMGKFGSTGSVSTQILALAVAIGIISHALKEIEALRAGKLVDTMRVFVEIAAIVTAAMFALGKASASSWQMAAQILAFSIAIKMLVGALKQIETIDPSWKNAGILAGLMAALAFMPKIMSLAKIAGKEALAAGGGILMISVAIGIIAHVVGTLNKLQINVATIGKLTVLGGALVGLMAATKLAGKHAASAGAGLLAVSVAIGVLAFVVDKLRYMHIDLATVGKLVVLVGVLAGLMAATKLAGKHAIGAGVGMLAVASAIGLLAISMAILSKIDPDGLKRAELAITILGGIMSALIISTHWATSSMKTIVALSIALGVLATSLGILSMIDPDGLRNATVALSVIMGMFALMTAATGLAGAATATLGLMVGAIAMLGAVLYGLSALKVENALPNAIALGALMLALTAAMTILSKDIFAASLITSIMGPLAVMVGVIALLGLILAGMSALHTADALPNAVGLSALLLAMSGSLLILSGVGALAGPATAGAAILLGFILVLGALMEGIGALFNNIDGLSENMTKGMEVLQQIGTGLGNFFGGIAGGFMSTASDALPKVGENLAGFFNNLKSAFDGIGTVDDSKIAAMGGLADIILKMTGSGLMDSVAKFIGGETNFGKFGEQLKEFFKQVSEMSQIGVDTDAKPLNVENLEKYVTAAQSVLKLLETVPKFDGIKQRLEGNMGFDAFGIQIARLFSSIAKMSNIGGTEASSFKPERFEQYLKASKKILELLQTPPKFDGIQQWVDGSMQFDTFGRQIETLFSSIVQMSNVGGTGVKEFQPERFEQLLASAKKILELLNGDVPKFGGWEGLLNGNLGFDKFATQLGSLFSSIVDMSNTIGAEGASFNPEQFDQYFAAAEKLLSFIDEAQAIKGLQTAFSSGINFSGYAEQMKQMVSAIIEMSNATGSWGATFNSEQFGQYTKAIDDLLQFADKIKQLEQLKEAVASMQTLGEVDFSNFSTNISGMIEGLKNMSTSLSDFNVDNVEIYVQGIKDIATSIQELTAMDLGGIDSFAESMSELGKTSIDSFVNSFQGAGEAVTQAVNEMTSALSSAASNIDLSSFETIGQNAATALCNSIANSVGMITTAAQSIVTALYNAFNSYSANMTAVGTALGNAFVQGLQSVSGAASAAGQSLVSAATSAMQGGYAAAFAAGANIGQGLVDGMRSKVAAVQAQAAALSNAAAAASAAAAQIKSPSRVFMRIGGFIAQGLAIGIQNGTGRVMKSGVAMANAVVESSKRALGINSPSKVMRDEVGHWIVEGITEGIKDDMSPEEAAKKKAENIVNAFKEALDRVDLTTSIVDLENTLWKQKGGDSLSAEEKAAADLKVYERQLEGQRERIELAEAEYQQMLAEFGEDDDNTRSSYKKWLQEQIDLEEMRTKHEDTLKKEALAVYDTETKRREKELSVEENRYKLWEKSYGKRSSLEEKETQELASLNKRRAELYKQRITAIRKYNEAVEQYGLDSDEALDALIESQKAEENLLESGDKILEAQKKYINERTEQISLQSKITQKQYESWSDANDLTAKEGEKQLATLDNLSKQIGYQAQIIEQNKRLLDIARSEFGEESSEYLKALETLEDSQATLKEHISESNKTVIEFQNTFNDSKGDYLKFLADYKDVFLGMGYTMSDIESFAEKASGFKTEWLSKPPKEYFGEIENLGTELGETLGSGIQNGLSEVASQTATTVGDSATWNESGKAILDGLSSGMEDTNNAMSDEIVDTITSACATAVDIINNSDEYRPVIRPVVDMTDVDTFGLITAGQTFGLNANTSMRLASGVMYTGPEEGVIFDDSKIVDAINDLGIKVDAIEGVVGNLKVVMDSGALVGQITPAIDRQLGQTAALRERGV